jgi:hypothetical protein
MRLPAVRSSVLGTVTLAALAALAACARGGAAAGPAGGPGAGPAATAPAAGAVRQQAGGWRPLFDGSGLGAWRGYQREAVPAAWRAEGGVLTFVPVADREQRGDLITREQFGDFELEYEWRVVPRANSGVMWWVSEDHPRTWHTGPEMQVLDDDGHPDGRIPSHRAGALYDLVVPPPGLTRPVGEFNQARVVVQGSRAQLFLNGRQTADVDFESEGGRQLVARSKFDTMPRYAKNRRGHIALQDHGDTVHFRNIRIRPLDAAPR